MVPKRTKLSTGGVINPNDPTDKGKRKNVPKDVIVKLEGMRGPDAPPSLVNIEDNDPLFYDRNQFVNYYRNKAVNALKPEDRTIYDTDQKLLTQADRDAFLTARGGIPDYESYIKQVRAYEQSQIIPTNWPKLARDSNAVDRGVRIEDLQGVPVRRKGGKLIGPSHENGGVPIYDRRTGRQIVEAEGEERLFSVQDSQEIERLANSLSKKPSKSTAQKLGNRVSQMVREQDRNQAQDNKLFNIFTQMGEEEFTNPY